MSANLTELVLERDEGVATLTINRADKMNAMTTEMWLGFRDMMDEVRNDDEIKVLVLTGTGRAFCAGSDIVSRLASYTGSSKQQDALREKLEPIGHSASLMHNMPKPIIGAINGVAAGAGLSLALLCDIRIASEQARFAASWIKVGLGPDYGASYLLPRIVGMDKAMELALTGDVVDAREAERLRMVTRVVPHDDVIKVSQELARRLAQGPTIAIGLAKKELYRSWHNSIEEQIDLENYVISVCRASQDHAEAVAAFREKRPPQFRGR